MHKLISFINCTNFIYIVDDHLIFLRITCLQVFMQSYMLLNINENTKGKCQFDDLKSCYPITT